MKVFADTNIIIDIMEKRELFYEASANILQLAEDGKIQLFVSPLTMINVIYICRKTLGKEEALKQVKDLRSYVSISPMTEKELDKAIELGGKDIEDNLQFFSADSADCTIIVTRNINDFPKNSNIWITTPENFLNSDYIEHSVD